MAQLLHTMNPAAAWSLEVQGLRIRKGGHTILDDFSWLHHPGEVAWVVGENGAGKSSLLRLLAGRERPREGTVQHIAPDGVKPDVIYYHPETRLPDQITVRDWTRFLDRIAPTLHRYPLDPALHPEGAQPLKRVEHLSTGEAKRLVLMGLLSRDAPFLILDEPFEHLSREAKEILASHLVERAATRIVVVATNQEIPRGAGGRALRYNEDKLLVTSGLEVMP
jgi:ABC-type multidrug transport system ATPase subunit